MWVLDNHLSTYGNLAWVVCTSWLLWAFVTNVCKLRMAPLCVAVG